nr:DNA helicase [Tanacetum cinerariifolium]
MNFVTALTMLLILMLFLTHHHVRLPLTRRIIDYCFNICRSSLLYDACFVAQLYSYTSVFVLGPQEQNTSSRTRREYTIRRNSLCGQSRVSTPPSEYKHIGNCTHTCQHCGALFWYEERLKSSMPRGSRPRYNNCCKVGRDALRTYQIYPEYMKLLLEVRHFLENIRAYNQMFSMTSLGAQVDESINNGRVPYVFKISGQLYHWIGTARKKLQDAHISNFKVRLYNVVGAREYELPTRDMICAIVYEPGLETDMDYDIIIDERSGYPQHVNKLHPSYMSLQFPLLFIDGQDGYSKELRIVNPIGSSFEQKHVSMLAYYSYYLYDRANQYNYLSRTRRLFQQYVVTAFCVIEQNRIDYVHEHQNDIRNEYLSGIYYAINRSDNDAFDCGSRLILPQSFTGGPRYMYNHYLDALSICRVHGNPSFFITYICNIKWPEIIEYMAQFLLLTTTDRADVVDRVFEMKIHQLINFVCDAQPFGKTTEVLYTVEFQKRGLPHCHTLLWIAESARVCKEEDIDVYISAELPPKDVDP